MIKISTEPEHLERMWQVLEKHEFVKVSPKHQGFQPQWPSDQVNVGIEVEPEPYFSEVLWQRKLVDTFIEEVAENQGLQCVWQLYRVQ